MPRVLPHLSFVEGVSLDEMAPDRLVVRSHWQELGLVDVSPGMMSALRRLAAEGATEDAMAEEVRARDGGAALPLLYFYLSELRRRRLLAHAVVAGGELLATLLPGSLPLQPRDVEPERRYVLSRFASLRRDGARWVLESPLGAGRVLLHDARAGALCLALASAAGVELLARAVPGLTGAEVEGFCALLLGAGLIAEADERGRIASEEEGALALWEFHDLLFHGRSRLGRHLNGYGGTYRFLGKIEPLPAVKPAMSGEAVALPQPDLDRLRAEDPPFAAVLERRRSTRAHGAVPLTRAQLGEFLYRVARVRRIIPTERGELSSRPYPSGGASYELELYLSVSACEDLERGLYHYEPLEHRLTRISGWTPAVQALVHDATVVSRESEPPQIVITLAARFQRVFWKYESMAYGLILKNVGALYQSMYLAAAAMGLAACALGGGNPDVFAAATGLAYPTEGSVGEFLLGSLPADDSAEPLPPMKGHHP